MYRKNKLFYSLTLMLSLLFAVNANGQYKETRSNKETPNTDFTSFASEADQLFNFDWMFQMGNPSGAQSLDLDDSAWRSLDLPHDFQFEMPWDSLANKGRGFKAMGEAWYRKHFTAPQSWQDKHVSLDFGGIMYYGDVYVNGKKAAASEYGYVGFEVDITKYLRFGQDNVVAVYCNTAKENASRWYTGGGIFRDVWLRLRNTTRIARHGIFVTTADNKTASIQVEVDHWQKHGDVRIDAVIKDAAGNIVGTASSPMPDHTIQNCTEVQLPKVDVADAHVWDINDPYLYTAEVTVTADSVVADRQSVQFGFRTIEFGTDFGFKLNGKKVFLQGLANHHDLGALGVAAFDKAIEREMLQLKAFGYNAIRCSHNPYSESFTKIADRLGLLIVDELIDKWSDTEYWGGRKPFTAIWPDLMQEWIKRDRNSPSVILWSFGNELQTRDDWSGYKTHDWGITTYRMMNVLQKRYDPTRLSTVAMFPARAGGQRNTPDFWEYLVPPELACATEVSSFNYQWKAYKGYYEHKPDLILFQSEAVTSEVLGPFWGMDRKRGVGLAYWGGIEYWGESNSWPKKGWNYSFFSSTLEPYPQAYCIKSAFVADEPLVRLGVENNAGELMMWNDIKVGKATVDNNWNTLIDAKTQQPQQLRKVYTYTNADEVELFLNGKSLGVKPNKAKVLTQQNTIVWDSVQYEPGTLLAVARTNGREVARHKIETTGRAVALKVVMEGSAPFLSAQQPSASGTKTPAIKADGMDLQYCRVYAVDSKGRVVPDATDDVTYSVSGAATFVAVDNNDHYTNLLCNGVYTKPLTGGHSLVIMRAKRTAGKATLTLTSPTLKGKKVTFQVGMKN